jgi:hypothetical protein
LDNKIKLVLVITFYLEQIFLLSGENIWYSVPGLSKIRFLPSRCQ